MWTVIKRKALTPAQLAEEIGVESRLVNDALMGKPLDSDDMVRLAEALGEDGEGILAASRQPSREAEGDVDPADASPASDLGDLADLRGLPDDVKRAVHVLVRALRGGDRA